MEGEVNILREVEERKRRAWESAVPHWVSRLFDERFSKVPPGTDFRELGLPESVQGLVIKKTEHGKMVSLTLESGTYEFSSHVLRWPDENHLDVLEGGLTIRSTLSLKRNNELLLELECSRTTSGLGIAGPIPEKESRVDNVTAFVNGPWVEEIKYFAGQVFNVEDMQKVKLREEQKQSYLEEMKKRFGL
jgi:hypothetical protein